MKEQETISNNQNKSKFNSTKPYLLLWEAHSVLELQQGDLKIPVRPVSNFPWSHPESFVSLCDSENNELLVLEDLDELTLSSKEALKNALKEVRFVLEVKTIHSVKEESDLRIWEVQTQEGLRKFVTKLDAWPQALGGERVLITDVAGDLYEVKNMAEMDKRSQSLLWALVDWE